MAVNTVDILKRVKKAFAKKEVADGVYKKTDYNGTVSNRQKYKRTDPVTGNEVEVGGGRRFILSRMIRGVDAGIGLNFIAGTSKLIHNMKENTKKSGGIGWSFLNILKAPIRGFVKFASKVSGFSAAYQRAGGPEI